MPTVPTQSQEDADAAAAAAAENGDSKPDTTQAPANGPTDSTPASNSQDDVTPSTPATQAGKTAADQAKADKRTAEQRAKEIDAMDDLDEDEKQILKLYDQGVHMFKIAKDVFKFANSDTVGKVMLTVRKAHADDFNAVEDVNSTKGYTGVGVGNA